MSDDSPVVVQIRVVRWSQKGGAEQLEDTRELLVTPPVLQIPANSQQIVRVALRREPDGAQELTYRVIFEEVPQAAPQGFHRSARRAALEHPGIRRARARQGERGTGVGIALAAQRPARSGCNQ